MKIIPVILLLVFSCAVCAQELKEKYAEADGFRQKYEAGYFGGNITPRWIGNTHFCWYAVKKQRQGEPAELRRSPRRILFFFYQLVAGFPEIGEL